MWANPRHVIAWDSFGNGSIIQPTRMDKLPSTTRGRATPSDINGPVPLCDLRPFGVPGVIVPVVQRKIAVALPPTK